MAQRNGYFDKMGGEAAYAPEFDRQVPSVLTRSEVRREVAHARHDGALELMRGIRPCVWRCHVSFRKFV